MTIDSNQPLFYSLSLGAKRQFLYPVWERRSGVCISKLFEHSSKTVFNDTNGQISVSAGAKIRKAVDWLVLSAQPKSVFVKELNRAISFKLNFITLTLPCMQADVTDVEIKNKALNLFLTTCRQKYGMNNYIWKAEAQENGNIHFHVTTDIYIHWGDLRKLWNRCLNAFGYIAQYRANMQAVHAQGFHFREDLAKHWSREKQYQAYLYGCKTDWSDPNTTDVHAVRKISNLAGYLTKYFTKNDTTRRPIKGRLWGMAVNLSKIIKARVEFTSDVTAELMHSFLNNKLVKVPCDYGISYKATASEIITHVGGKLGECFKTLLGYLRKPPSQLTAEMLVF